MKMIEHKWTEAQWETLIHSIAENRCILMLGPDASSVQINGKYQALTKLLAKEMSKAINPVYQNNIDKSNLTQVSQYYWKDYKRNSLEAKVKSFYKNWEKKTTRLHKNLAVLPFYLAIISSPDKMFFNAMKQAKKEPIIDWYHFNNKRTRTVNMGTVDNPLLFYLYGCVEDPTSLVLSENDLMTFFRSLISKTFNLPGQVQSELQKKEKSFLFLGFGFKNWYLRILFDFLFHKIEPKNELSFSLEQCMKNDIEFQRATLFFTYYDECKTFIYNKELNGFVEELKKRYKREFKSSIIKKKVHLDDVRDKPRIDNIPKIFLCYTHEDKDYANLLYEELENENFKPWLDEKSLRGGDEWKYVIPKVIETVDYMVVLQSKALEEKEVGYVNLEINTALKRQEMTKKGIPFIIPVTIEDCSIREELSHLTTIDVQNDGSFNKLFDLIKDDQRRRKGEDQ